MPTWQQTVTVGGVDVSVRCRGQIWHRQEESAAHVCRLRLAAIGTDLDAEADAFEGAAVSVAIAWDGAAPSVRFSGWVQSADYESVDGVLLLECTDRLQEWAEAQDEAAIDAAIAGSQRHPKVQAARADGWRQLLDCLKTVRASYAIGRDGVHRCTPWALATPAQTLGPADHLEDGVRVLRRPLRERTNRVVWTIEVRATVLHEAQITAGFGFTGDFCDWWADRWVLIPTDSVSQAVQSAGPVYRPDGSWVGAETAADGGINYTRMPESGTHNCGGPVVWVQDGSVCTGASWQWQMRWTQTATVRYQLVVESAAAISAWGLQIDERTAALDAEGDYDSWGESTGGRPLPDDWEAAGGDERLVAIDAADEQAAIESALAEADATLCGAHRQDIEVQCLPWRVATLDLHHTARLVSGVHRVAGRVAVIEEYWSLDDWDAVTTLILRRSRGPAGSCSATPLNAPSRPVIPVGYSIDTSLSFPLRLGGKAEAAAYDGTWRGVTSNYYDTDSGAEVYPYRAAFERPAVPAVARDAVEVAGTATWTVCIPRDEVPA